jgi:hypothetical protein
MKSILDKMRQHSIVISGYEFSVGDKFNCKNDKGVYWEITKIDEDSIEWLYKDNQTTGNSQIKYLNIEPYK